MINIRMILPYVLCMQVTVLPQRYSLQQCIDFALANNSRVKIAVYDLKITETKINEAIGSGLPQISASGSLDDNLDISTQLLPGELVGKPGTTVAVQMGTQYSMSLGVKLEQKIFNPVFWVGLKSAQTGRQRSAVTLEQTREATVYSVCRAYYQTLVLQKQQELLASICATSEENLKATKLKYANGSAKQIDVDQIEVNHNNSISRQRQSSLNGKQALNSLKYQIGLPVDSELVLSDTLNTEPLEIPPATEPQDCFGNRKDYQILKLDLLAQQEEKNRCMANFLPSLSCNASYGYQSMPDSFTFNGTWYKNSSIGLSLSIPIFDGLQKHAELSQAIYAIAKVKENLASAEQSIRVDVANYESQYRIARDNLSNEKANVLLAQNVYKDSQLSYQQGAGSLLELMQAESSLR